MLEALSKALSILYIQSVSLFTNQQYFFKFIFMRALLIVDLQNDFLPAGSLGVKEGDKIIPTINSLMDSFPIIIASKDWHPEGSVHFDYWPVHCVANTEGAAFPDSLDSNKIQDIFYKGTDNKDDGYSAFEATNKNLTQYLSDKKVEELYVVGIATDYCVKASVIDALNEEIKTYIITDAIKAVNQTPGDDLKALEELEGKGAILISSHELLKHASA